MLLLVVHINASFNSVLLAFSAIGISYTNKRKRREFILAAEHMFILSKNKMLTKFAQAYGIRFGAGRFVAGETLTEAVKTVKRLNQKGCRLRLII